MESGHWAAADAAAAAPAAVAAALAETFGLYWYLPFHCKQHNMYMYMYMY